MRISVLPFPRRTSPCFHSVKSPPPPNIRVNYPRSRLLARPNCLPCKPWWKASNREEAKQTLIRERNENRGQASSALDSGRREGTYVLMAHDSTKARLDRDATAADTRIRQESAASLIQAVFRRYLQVCAFRRRYISACVAGGGGLSSCDKHP